MNRTKGATLLTGILIALFASMVGLAQSGPAPLGIIPTPSPTALAVSIWTDKPSYAIGQNVAITYAVNLPAYVYIYDIQPDGIVRLVFPNQFSPSNYVSAGTHNLPDGMYKFTVYPPTGTEQLQIIASGMPLNLSPTSYSEPFPMVGPNPGAAAMGIQAQIKGIIPEPQWATAWTSFVIVTSYSYTPPSPPSGTFYYIYPPFVGFPGGTWYWDGSQWVFGVPESGFYWYFGSDGHWYMKISFHFQFGG
jgi:hypothetical protein